MGLKGEHATGGSRPEYALRPRRSEDEWAELMAERAAPSKGRGTPIGIIRRPVQEVPMVNIKDGEEAES